ncbi:MAG: uracil-xanthine permease [Clostridiales bacterium]|nr:uracil-xanthine permease [Candidatus Equinaster intestinalis]
MKLTFGVKDKPKFGQLIVFAFQQLLAIMAATIAVPMIIGNGMSTVAALFGAGAGTIIYVLFTKAKSPVFLGSSFAFLGSMGAAFAGAATVELGYMGLIIGAIFAGLVYVVIALIVKFAGVDWINKLMPAAVIGPTVAIIGLGLAGNAIGDFQKGSYVVDGAPTASVYVAIICGLVTLFVTMICSVFGKKMTKLVPFILGIVAGYAAAAIFTVIGIETGNDALRIIDFSGFEALVADGVGLKTFISVPEFTFIKAFGAFGELSGDYIATIAVAYVPVAFVVFAEHIADHKNISSIIETDLLEEPGLHRTLLGDGVGSMVGAFFGGAPNTTYGESIACVAISGNASVATIICTAFLAIIIAFIAPFATFLASIPSCVMGGVCIALYGFIAVSGLKMVQKVDLEDNRNLFTVSVILIAGIGGLTLTFGQITITSVACALILGIITNLVLKLKKD